MLSGWGKRKLALPILTSKNHGSFGSCSTEMEDFEDSTEMFAREQIPNTSQWKRRRGFSVFGSSWPSAESVLLMCIRCPVLQGLHKAYAQEGHNITKAWRERDSQVY